jgi:hypothetical protein
MYLEVGGPATLITKDGQFKVEVDSAGYLNFEIQTEVDPLARSKSIETFSVRSARPLRTGVWEYVEAEYIDGRARVMVGQTVESVMATGSLVAGTADLVIGQGIVGNLDRLILNNASVGSSLITVTGIAKSGTIILDENGQAEVTVQSLGAQVTDIERINVRVMPIGDVAKGLDINLDCLFYEIISLKEKRLFGWSWEFGEGFVTGQGDGFAGAAGDIAAGVFIWGDIRDCAIQAVRALHPNYEADWAVFGFAAAGLLLEAAPGISEPVDAVLAAVKTGLKRLPNGPMRRMLADVPGYMFDLYKKSDYNHLVITAYAVQFVDFFKYLFDELTPTQLQRWANVISSPKKLEIAARMFREACGVSKSRPCIEWFEDILANYSDEAAEKFTRIFSEVDDVTKLAIRNSDLAADGLARLMKVGANPEVVTTLMKNGDAFTDIYKQQDLLVDAQKLLEATGTRLDVDSLNGALSKISKQTPENYQGFTLELRAAAELAAERGRGIVDIDSLDGVGIDLAGAIGEMAYQVKRSQSALYSKGGNWAGVKQYLENGIAAAKESGLTDYRLCFPQGAKDYFTQGMRDTLQSVKFNKNGPSLWDTLEEIPGMISDPSSLPRFAPDDVFGWE